MDRSECPTCGAPCTGETVPRGPHNSEYVLTYAPPPPAEQASGELPKHQETVWIMLRDENREMPAAKMYYTAEQMRAYARAALSRQPKGLSDSEAVRPVVDQAMRKVAAIAHSGGLLNMSEADALTAIRRLSLPFWAKEEKPEQVHSTLAPQQPTGEEE